MPSNFFSIPKRYTSAALIKALGSNIPAPKPATPRPAPATPSYNPQPISPVNNTPQLDYSALYPQQQQQPQQDYIYNYDKNENTRPPGLDNVEEDPRLKINEKYRYIGRVGGGASGNTKMAPARPQFTRPLAGAGSFGLGNIGSVLDGFRSKKKAKSFGQASESKQSTLLGRYLGGSGGY